MAGAAAHTHINGYRQDTYLYGI